MYIWTIFIAISISNLVITFYLDFIKPDSYINIECFDKNGVLVEKTSKKTIQVYGSKNGIIKKCVLTQQE